MGIKGNPKDVDFFVMQEQSPEPSARRLWDCYANQFFHPNAPTCHFGVFAFVILKEGIFRISPDAH